jgi:anaerobic C4-dicarboxylate transporter
MNDNTIIRIKVPAHLYESVKAKLMVKEETSKLDKLEEAKAKIEKMILEAKDDKTKKAEEKKKKEAEDKKKKEAEAKKVADKKAADKKKAAEKKK